MPRIDKPSAKSPTISPDVPKPLGSTPRPFDRIEAPSTANLELGRIREEVFHLERSNASVRDSNHDLSNKVNELSDGIDKLQESVDDLSGKMETLTDNLANWIDRIGELTGSLRKDE